jgi:hypothetical protein
LTVFKPDQVPSVTSDELLARFILFSRHFRRSDNTIRPEAFIPHPLVELSVTRHRDATDEDVWTEGRRVAAVRKVTLYGRADVVTKTFTELDLIVQAAPITENPNHANVTGWPHEKSAQKMKAIDVANAARFETLPA